MTESYVKEKYMALQNMTDETLLIKHHGIELHRVLFPNESMIIELRNVNSVEILEATSSKTDGSN